ncbi:acyclic terpene utilization AtuA family protein [Aquabacter cavernae]|uniref:acyclic terpene utilization AtuA family protein n=1 Tax=Aquabacter cavernae TaxID=2496029 RepID=UPI000F8E02DC|nr:acyclic terpene utilization AtuA family protein [Aquabacter cavernae]
MVGPATAGTDVVRIGSGAGFAGDRTDAAGPVVAELARHDGPRFLIFETLAERTLALCQLARRADPAKGYSPALEKLLAPVLSDCLKAGIRIVGNFGAANPQAAAARIADLARAMGHAPRIGVVTGSDLDPARPVAEYAAREMGTLLAGRSEIVSADAYIGAAAIADALELGADIVVTGRVADPALALGPLLHVFGWSPQDWDRMAAGTLAGHLLECGAQVCGGYFADPGAKDVPGLADVGFPIAEIGRDGTITITKPPGTGGRVDRFTVTEQMLYEIHDPAAYLTPDVVMDITQARVEELGADRVRITGVKGKPRPETLKATVCFEAGYLAEGEISYAGPNAAARARLAAQVVRERLARRAPGLGLRVDAIGIASVFNDTAGATLDGLFPATESADVRLRFSAQSSDKALLDLMLDEVEGLYCAGPAGGGGVRRHLTARLASASCLVERAWTAPRATLFGAAS